MSASPTDKRIDPLIDAYRQASELDAQHASARPSSATRAAVLAHARVVAQSATHALAKPAVTDAVRATTAANEPKPVWRMVAGVVLGLAAMWVYQLTRPGTVGEANVAVLSAPQSATAASAPVDPTAAQAGAATVPSAPSAPSAPTVAAASEITTAGTVAGSSPEAIGSGTRNLAAEATRAGAAPASATRSAAIGAQASAAAPLTKADATPQTASPSPFPTTASASAKVTSTGRPSTPTNATEAATSAIPEAATSEPLGEVSVAVADTRKLARVAETRAMAAPPAPPAPAAPAAPTVAATAPDVALFNAVRLGSLPALRAALARGANVNARDDAGRSALHIAQERRDADMVKALELAGAK